MSELENRTRRLRFDHGDISQQDLVERAGGCTPDDHRPRGEPPYVPSFLLAHWTSQVFGLSIEEVFQPEE
jgi:hypothetical protein